MESLFAVSSGGTALSGSPPGNVLDRVCVFLCGLQMHQTLSQESGLRREVRRVDVELIEGPFY